MSSLNILRSKINENEIFPLDSFRPVNDIEVLPQFDGTCWFNSLLMVLLYSQGIRKVIIQEVAKWTHEEITGNRLKEFIVYVLKYNYTEPERIKELFRKRFKTTSLLLSLLKGESSLETLKEKIKQQLKQDLENFSYYPIVFLAKYNFLSLFFSDYSIVLYDGKYTKTLPTFNNPKIVIILHNYFQYIFLNMKENNVDLSLFSTIIKSKGIDELEETITLNGIKYKLDACIIDNYNNLEIPSAHSISGITYNNNTYVYNGWTLKKQEREKYYYKRKYACPLFPFDWKSSITERKSNPFCFSNSECKLKDIQGKDLCFDFNAKQTETILFYVREDEYQKQTLTLEQEIAKEKLQYRSSSLSSLVKEFYKLEEDSNEHLLKHLIQLYGEQIIKNLIKELFETNNYSIFYFMLCNSILSEDKATLTEEEILKKFYISLLKIYIKKNRKFDFGRVSNSKIDSFITIKTLKELLKGIGYTEEDINIIITNNKDYLILWYLLNKNVSNIKVNFTPIDLLVKLLEFFLAKKKKLNIIDFDNEEILYILFEFRKNTSSLDTTRIEFIEKLLKEKPILKEIKLQLLDEITHKSETQKYNVINYLLNKDLEDLIFLVNI